MMLKVMMSTEAGNAAIANGRMPEIVTGFIDEVKPEAAYFAADNGLRTAYFFFDLEKAEDLPFIAERFFMNLGARVEITPAMNTDEMKAGVRRAMSKR